MHRQVGQSNYLRNWKEIERIGGVVCMMEPKKSLRPTSRHGTLSILLGENEINWIVVGVENISGNNEK